MEQLQNIKKRQELLRSFFYDIEIHDKNRLMEWLGISSSTYYKTLKEMVSLLGDKAVPAKGQSAELLRQTVKYEPYSQTTNFLSMLYQSIHMREKAAIRFNLILVLLNHYGELSTNQLMDHLSTHHLDENMEVVFLTEPEITRYLKDLEQEGFISRQLKKGEKRQENYYQLRPFFDSFSLEELIELHSFISFCMNTEIPSAPGYPLSIKLTDYIESVHDYPIETLHDTDYKYPYFGRVLDEYIVYSLLHCIKDLQSTLVSYQSVNSEQKHVVMSDQLTEIHFIPLQIVFDYLYARWYVIGAEENQDENKPLRRLRIDFIAKVSPGRKVPEADWNEWMEQAKRELEKAWTITSKEATTNVRIRFDFFPDRDGEGKNFIRKRVEEQGQWGEIIEEAGNSFVWEVEVFEPDELIPWIRSFGSSATVLEPLTLREKLYESWKEVAEQYEHHF